MRISDQIERMHESGDVGNHLDVYAEKIRLMEDAILKMVYEGWLDHGSEGMSDGQKLCQKACLMLYSRGDVKKSSAKNTGG